MPDDRIRYSDLEPTPATDINNNARLALANGNGQSFASIVATLTAIGTKLNNNMEYSTALNTDSKTIIGAINELNAGGGGGGSSTFSGLSDVDIDSQTLANGQVPVYNSNTQKWENGESTGGHTIVDDSGTDLTQRSNLQFKGAYSKDNSTDDTTEVNVIRNMTKAEFDLLSDDEKVGIINLTDVTGGGENEFQPVVYSEDEREIGVWTDGRPLYQKTIDFGALPNNSSKVVNHNISNLDITAIAALEIVAQQGTYATFPRIHDSLINQQIFFEVTATQIGCYSRNTDSSSFNGHITIRYCKTTDTPGSGQWTPQGVPAVHYSTDEQVVGTWINGETIYEKVVSGTTSSTPTTLITGIDKIISVCGYADRYPVPMLPLDDNRKFISVVGSSGNAILSVSGSQYVGLNYDIAIRYTKTAPVLNLMMSTPSQPEELSEEPSEEHEEEVEE